MYYYDMARLYYPRIVEKQDIAGVGLEGLGEIPTPQSGEDARNIVLKETRYITDKLDASQKWAQGAIDVISAIKEYGYTRERYENFRSNMEGATSDLDAARQKGLDLFRAHLMPEKFLNELLDKINKIDVQFGKVNVQGEDMMHKGEATIFGIDVSTYYTIITGIFLGPVAALLADAFGVTQAMEDLAMDAGADMWKAWEKGKEWVAAQVPKAADWLKDILLYGAIIVGGVTILPRLLGGFKSNPKKDKGDVFLPLLLVGGGGLLYWMMTSKKTPTIPTVSAVPMPVIPAGPAPMNTYIGSVKLAGTLSGIQLALNAAGFPFRVEDTGAEWRIYTSAKDAPLAKAAYDAAYKLYEAIEKITAPKLPPLEF